MEVEILKKINQKYIEKSIFQPMTCETLKNNRPRALEIVAKMVADGHSKNKAAKTCGIPYHTLYNLQKVR